ncbi:recombinase family protein [Nocardia sp. NPDC051756]|uniref:recombinase family protein n=1 Tax=Nocardia sp. NPDC051756 TaxID=3154751 RepID=UPI0034347E28
MGRRMVDGIVSGGSLTQPAREFNDEGVVTPAEYHRALKAGVPTLLREDLPTELLTPPETSRQRKQRPPRWTQTPIRNMLQSPAIRGFVHHNGDVVRGGDGMALQFAEPSLRYLVREATSGVTNR